MRRSPHLHVVALDGVWFEKDGELGGEGLGHLRTSEVGEVLERVIRRMERHLHRSGQLRTVEDEAEAPVEQHRQRQQDQDRHQRRHQQQQPQRDPGG
ncbi:MAG: hypothetical protein HC767_13035 [Akkermansiaceae bacterium]|nr:hypothetical protein [Akkermansiaceae bacterium]